MNNYYSPARSQAFQTLGTVTMNGVELAINIDPSKSFKTDNQSVNIGISVTYMNSEITSGTMVDGDLFAGTVFHTEATKTELIEKLTLTEMPILYIMELILIQAKPSPLMIFPQ